MKAMLRDLRADWRRWTAAERLSALGLVALLAAAIPLLAAMGGVD